jgi:DNA polymerase-4
MSSAPPRILCYDARQFFVRCAYLAWPEELAGVELLAVGGHPERRGVVASASYAARERGVRSGMPMATAVRMVPELVAVPVPRSVVHVKKEQVRAVIRRYAEAFETASVDEGYLQVAESDEPLEAVARRIREAVGEETEIECDFGGATLRYLSKMATRRAKRSGGVYVVPAGGEIDFLDSEELGSIPGIGPAFLESLERRGVRTTAGARRIELRTLVRWLKPARAHFLYNRVRAIDPSRIGEDREARKSISAETTFERDLLDTDALDAALHDLAADVGQSLRRLGLEARTIGVKLREADFTDHGRSRTLPQFITTDRVIYETARELLHELRAAHRAPVRLLGVALSGLSGPGAAEQLTFREIIPPIEE